MFLLGLDFITLAMFFKFNNKLVRERLHAARDSLRSSLGNSASVLEISQAKAHRKYLVYRELANEQIKNIIATMTTMKECRDTD